MPTYQYKCSSCHHSMEAFQKISDPALTLCPACQKETLRRVPTVGLGFQLNGGGWYETGYQKSCCPCGKNESCSTETPAKPASE